MGVKLNKNYHLVERNKKELLNNNSTFFGEINQKLKYDKIYCGKN